MALIKRVIELVVMFKIELREKTRRIGTYPSLSTLHSLFLIIHGGTLLVLGGFYNHLTVLFTVLYSHLCSFFIDLTCSNSQ
jgi:hypothetical protein